MGAARNGDHARAGLDGKLRQQGAQEADADDGDRLPLADEAALEDVHRASQRLARKGLISEARRQRDDGIGIRQIVRRIGVVGQGRDPHAGPEVADIGMVPVTFGVGSGWPFVPPLSWTR